MEIKEKFMKEALKEAKKAYNKEEVPVGAVIVKEGKIIARAHNLKESKGMATSHAEILAIEKACKKIGAWRLSDCEMYVTLEPCAMCAGALINARIKKLYIGTKDEKTGACGSKLNILEENMFNHNVEVESNILKEDCELILKEFFKMLRERNKNEKKDLIKKSAFFSTIAIIILIVVMIMLKYEVEGEKSLPYKLSKILLISTVDGKFIDDPEHIWNIDVTQTNDVYIYIDADGETKETIKQISLENFSLVKEPQKGSVAIYRPTAELDNLYTYSEQNYLNDKIVFSGAKIDDMKSLEIANNGGVVGFRLSLNELGKYISNEATEITYDGRLLSNLGVSLEEIKAELSFDLIIETSSNIKYKGTISIKTPIEEIIEKGSSHIEITDFSDVIFKRI